MRSSSKGATNLKLYAFALLAAVAAAGCGSGSKPVLVVPDPSLPTGLPTPATPGPVNTYSGEQSPGAWTFTLDNTKDTFSYQPITYPASPNQPVTGSLQPAAGFSRLSSGGLALEVLGQAAVLRPGDSTNSPVFGVPQTECYAITGKLRFEYIDQFPGGFVFQFSNGAPPTLGYGSIVASTDTTGSNWQFENMQGNMVVGPASFAAKCAGANSQSSISFSGSSVLNDLWAPDPATVFDTTPTTKSNIWIGPSGFFAADQSDPTQTLPTGSSVAGVAEPSSPLSTSAVAAGQYLGFLYEAPVSASTNNPAAATLTAPVAFGQVASSGTTMMGGIFPNDDVTGTPNSDIEINLGSQSGTINGLYTSVSITVLDPAQNCANFAGSSNTTFKVPVTIGVNADGYITCTFPGVAVVGNPEGNYAIFVNTYNWAANLGGVPMQIYLFQP